MGTVKNIIFDLGGVLLDIDFNKTRTAFENLGVANFDSFYTKESANPIFESLETGDISNDHFYNSLQPYCSAGTTHAQLQDAWNQILIGFRKNSIAHLQLLKEKYNIYLLSNTNSIHHCRFTQMFEEEIGGPSFDSYFTRAWYSHLIRRRKPYPQTYLYVMETENLHAPETLFIDDAVANIEGAAQAGLQIRLLKAGERIEELGL